MKLGSPIFNVYERLLVILVAVAAFVLGVEGFQLYYQSTFPAGQSVSGSTLAYSAINLFILQGGLPAGHIPWQLDVARWLAPLSLSYAGFKTFLTLMGQRLVNWKVERLQGHAVICGLNELTVNTIETLIAKQIPVVVVARSIENPLYLRAQQIGGFVIDGNDQDPGVLHQLGVKNANYFIAATPVDISNVELTLKAKEIRSASKHEGLLKCATFVKDGNLAEALYEHPAFSKDDDFFAAHVTETNRLAARLLLNKHGPDTVPGLLHGDRMSLCIMIIGDHDLINSLVARFASIGHYGLKFPLRIVLVGGTASVRKQRLQSSMPALNLVMQIEAEEQILQVLNPELFRKSLDSINPDMVYVCERDTESTLSVIRLLARLRVELPVMIGNLGGDTASLLLRDAAAKHVSFKVVDLLRACGDFDVVLLEQQDRIARAIHERYVENERKRMQTIASNSSLEEWKNLAEPLKDANRNQADHIDVKCRLLLGLRSISSLEVQNALSGAMIDWLAQIEHQRWVAEKLLSGWRVTKGEKNIGLRLSPSLVDWELLDESEKQKDRDTILNLPSLVELKKTFEP